MGGGSSGIDWTHVIIGLFAATPPTLMALAALVASLRNRAIQEVHAVKAEATAVEVKAVAKEVAAEAKSAAVDARIANLEAKQALVENKEDVRIATASVVDKVSEVMQQVVKNGVSMPKEK